jgi:hypothetical protein
MFMAKSNLAHYPLRRMRFMVGIMNQQHDMISSCYSFSSSSPSFNNNNMFSYTSKRATRQRRKRLRQAIFLQKQQQRFQAKEPKNDTANKDDDDYVDTRTVRDILYPRPLALTGDDALQNKPFKLAKLLSFLTWKLAWQSAWPQYRSTWEGFWTSKGFIVEHQVEEEGKEKDKGSNDPDKTDKKDKVDDKDKNDHPTGQKESNDVNIQRNIRRNVQFLKTSSASLKENMSQQTGIRTAQDAKLMAQDGMRLFNEVIHEFMTGYRKGRDDEVERMLTEHYSTATTTTTAQDGQNDAANKDDATENKKKRKKKRRILSGTRA